MKYIPKQSYDNLSKHFDNYIDEKQENYIEIHKLIRKMNAYKNKGMLREAHIIKETLLDICKCDRHKQYWVDYLQGENK